MCITVEASKRSMAFSMKAKFDKYWGDPQKMNLLIFIANVLDPQYKLEYLQFSLNHMYGDSMGGSLYINVKAALSELFDDYSASCKPPLLSSSISGLSTDTSVNASAEFDNPVSLLKARFKKHKMELGIGGSSKTELEIYLSESTIEEEPSFNILRWWKLNSERFPVLSILARDVLAVPISTVASESAFSTGGRVLDCFRSSLTPKVVEALICGQDWIRISKTPISVEESLEEIEKFEKGTVILISILFCKCYFLLFYSSS